jgi:hypothetical protein
MPELPIHPAPESPEATAPTSLPPADVMSAMTPRFNLFFRWFARRFFSHFGLDERSVAELRTLERQGTVVYVMRYASRLDYFLFNALFLREGLRLSRFANGIRFHYYRPLLEVLRILLGRRGPAGPERDRGFARELARGGQAFFLVLRTARLAACSPRATGVARAKTSSICSTRWCAGPGIPRSRSTWCPSRSSGERGPVAGAAS